MSLLISTGIMAGVGTFIWPSCEENGSRRMDQKLRNEQMITDIARRLREIDDAKKKPFCLNLRICSLVISCKALENN